MRLEEFEKDPTEHGPKLRNTRLDKQGISAKKLVHSRWNQCLIFNLANAAESTANASVPQFGERGIDWRQLFQDRIYRILLHDEKCRPEENETHEQRLQHLAKDHDRILKRNGETNIRHLVGAPCLT